MHDQERTLVQMRARRPSANGAPVVFPDLRARRPWWRSPLVLVGFYPICFALGAVVGAGVRP